MKFSSRNIFALLAVSASLLTSCSDDVLFNDEQKDDSNQGVILYIPEIPADVTPVTGTRGDGQLIGFTRSETTISNRRLLVYEYNTATGTVAENPCLQYDIKNLTPLSGANDGYAAYKLQLATGNYKMYVTANIDLPDEVTYSSLRKTIVTVPSDLNRGLPMSCSNEELEVEYENTGSSVLGNGYVSISPGAKDVTIIAKLKYCVAKVRVTTINDLRPNELVTGISVANHITNSSIFNGKWGEIRDTKEKELRYKAKTDSTVDNGKYYQLANIASSGIKETNIEPGVSGIGEPISITDPNSTPYTHQTIFYVPERLFQEGNDVTTVNLNIGGTVNKIPVGATEGSGERIVKRSYFYDYLGAPDGKFYLKVQPWSIDAMVGALYGQTYLHVNKNDIDVVAGEKIEIGYESNAKIEAISNFHGSKPIYTFEYIGGKLIVQLNSNLTKDEFNELYYNESNKNKWNYFTITAGTLIKKINVKSIAFDEFINLDVQDVTIDVATQKTSAAYSGTFTVPVRANIKKIKLTFDRSTWGSDLDLQRADGTSLSSGSEVEVENGMINLFVKYNNINTTNSFWTVDRDFPVKLEDVNGAVDTPPTMTIHVRAYRDKYIIHARLPLSGEWNTPHIFAYQPLKLPSDYDASKCKEVYGGTSPQPNQPVGDGSDAQSAAQEFDFTGGVVFKGWEYFDENSPNYLYQAGRTDGKGFWCFNKQAQNNNEWSPGEPNYERHYYNIDFASDQRSKISCTSCVGLSHDRGWPGIQMINEGDGWWRFELSGVATPGRTLIQFNVTRNNNHQWANGMLQYPGAGEPGIGLFDYPSKEAWIDYTNEGTRRFSPDKEGSNIRSQNQGKIRTYRIYWPYSASDWIGLNVWKNARVFGNGIYSSWDSGNSQRYSNFTFNKYNAVYAYMEFKTTDEELTGDVSYQRIEHSGNNGYSAEKNISFGSFSQSGDIYTYTFTSFGSGRGGTPDGVTPTNDYITYRLYWYRNYKIADQDSGDITRESIYVWDFPTETQLSDGSGLSNNKDYKATNINTGANKCYFEFKIKKDNDWSNAHVIIKQTDTWNNQTGNISISKGQFSDPTGSGVYTYSLESLPKN